MTAAKAEGMPNKPGFNIGLLLNSFGAAFCMFLIVGLVGLYNDNQNNKTRMQNLEDDVKELKAENKELRSDLTKAEISSSAIKSSVDNIKDGINGIKETLKERK